MPAAAYSSRWRVFITPKEGSIKLFHDSDLHRNHPDFRCAKWCRSVMFCRVARKEKSIRRTDAERHSEISPFLSSAATARALRRPFWCAAEADEHGTDKIIAQKLARRSHAFARQRLAAAARGLAGPPGSVLINWPESGCPRSEDEARAARKISNGAQQNVIALMEVLRRTSHTRCSA